jgi:hypothetical protein
MLPFLGGGGMHFPDIVITFLPTHGGGGGGASRLKHQL